VIGDEGIAEIAQAIKYSLSLVHVDLSSNGFGYKGGNKLFKALAVNESVTSVDVSSKRGMNKNRIAAKGMKWIVPMLKHNKILSIIDLSGNTIKTEGLAFIAEGMVKNVTLMSLKVGYNEIQGNPETLKYLKAILLHSKLIELDISGNPLGNKCAEGMFGILTSEKTILKRLICSNIEIDCKFLKNKIIATCTQTIFNSIRSSYSLESVKLDKNNFSGASFAEYVLALAGPKSPLLWLSLNECLLGEENGRALFRVIDKNERLEYISVQGNSMKDLFASELAEALSDPLTALRILNVSQNKLTVLSL
jgi:Ran GTPase-activating protein (RanGAP) involved in mRNA processing and transport